MKKYTKTVESIIDATYNCASCCDLSLGIMDYAEAMEYYEETCEGSGEVFPAENLFGFVPEKDKLVIRALHGNGFPVYYSFSTKVNVIY